MSSPNRRKALAGAALAALAVLGYLLLRGKDGGGTGGAAGAPPGTGASDERGGADGAAAAHAGRGPLARASGPGAPTPDRLRQALDDYRRFAAYPHWSRPHDEGTRYLIEWNKPVISDLPMSDLPGHETMYRFGADRHHVTFGEPLSTWIEVWRLGDETRRLPVTVHAAYVMALSGPKQGRVIPLVYRDDGMNGDEVAGDLRYTNRFVPSEHEEMRQSMQVQIVADVEAGDMRKPIIRDFTCAPRPTIEIVGVSDSIKEGSLAVTLDVQVYEAGTYTFLANVYSGDGEAAISYSDVSYTLEAGRGKVDLRFFGKIFHDKGVDGPYLVKDFRGLLNLWGEEENIWWSDPRSHQTKPYKRTDFSPDEWDSEEKREKIKAFEDLISKTEAGEIGGPTDRPEHIHIGEDGVARPVEPGAPPPGAAPPAGAAPPSGVSPPRP